MEPELSLHYRAPESTDMQFLCKWESEKQAIGANLFRCVQIFNTTNQNPADRPVCVIFDALLHLLYFHVDQHNIL